MYKIISLIVVVSLFFTFVTTPAFGAVASTSAGEQLFKIIPGDSIFCVRANNFQNSLSQMDSYFSGAMPIPMGVSMLVRMQLAGLLSDPALKNVDMNGSFAVFAQALPVKDSNNIDPNAVFVAGLLPVTDYNAFVTENPAITKADGNGISMINRQGSSAALIVGNIKSYALITAKKDYSHIAKIIADANDNKSVTKRTALTEAQFGSNEPFWVYVNIKEVSEKFSKPLQMQVKEVSRIISLSTDHNSPAGRSDFLDYKQILNEGRYLTFSMRPSSEAISVTSIITARPDTQLGQDLRADSEKVKTILEKMGAAKPDPNSDLAKKISSMIPRYQNADFAGAYNILDQIKEMAKMYPGQAPAIEAESKSLLFYTGKFSENKLVVNVALSKEHFTEATKAYQAAVRTMMTQQMPNSVQPQKDANTPLMPIEEPNKKSTVPDDKQKKETVVNGNSNSHIIVAGVQVGEYKLGMSREQLQEKLGKPEPGNTIEVDGVVLHVIDGSLKKISVLNSIYKFANGLGVGDSEQQFKEAFGLQFKFEEDQGKLYLTYKNEGLQFIINKDTRAITEISIAQISESNIIIAGVQVGEYKLGMSREQLQEKLGRTEASNSISMDGLILHISNDTVKSIDVLAPAYRFGNGLGINDSEQKIKKTFGDNFQLKETAAKDYIAYEDEGLVFEIHKENRTIMEFSVTEQDSREVSGTNNILVEVPQELLASKTDTLSALTLAKKKELKRDYQSAIQLYSMIITDGAIDDVNAARAYCSMGDCYKRLDEKAKAIKCFEYVLKNFPEQKMYVSRAKMRLEAFANPEQKDAAEETGTTKKTVKNKKAASSESKEIPHDVVEQVDVVSPF